jgi:hypothetical protein
MRCTLVKAVRAVVCCKLHNSIFEEQGRRDDYLLRVVLKVLVLLLGQRLARGNCPRFLSPCSPLSCPPRGR